MPFGRRRPRPGDEPPQPSQARPAALALLTRRDYTAAEIRRKLSDRGHAADTIQDTLDALTSAGLLNDRRVASAHVATAIRAKGRGKMRIGRELEARGIDRALVRELLGGVSDDDESAAIARALARMRAPAAPDRDTRRKLFQRLLRRGFGADAITRALGARGAADHDEDFD